MFSVSSVEELLDFYKHEDDLRVNGVWSILLSNSPGMSQDFANKYFNDFNEIVSGVWHLGIFAKRCGNGQWARSYELHESVERVRRKLQDSGQQVPELSILFFDPHRDEESVNSLIIPLDENKIGSKTVYRSRFECTHECILTALRGMKLDPYEKIPSSRIPEVFEEIESELIVKKISAYSIPPIRALANAALGATLSAII